MKTVEPHQYRVHGNWLHFKGLDLEPIQIPFGLKLDGLRSGRATKSKSRQSRQSRTPHPRLRLETRGRQVAGIEVGVAGSWRRVLPAFTRVIRGAGRRRPALVIQLATLDPERRAAYRIIKRAHYLSVRDRGFVLLALIQDPRRAQRIRSRWWATLPRDAKAGYRSLERATGGTGRIVGALQLERLVHGNPLGRAAIYQWDRKQLPDGRTTRHPGFRWRVVRDLGLYWISRIAVDAPFRRLGIGSALCDAAREVAAAWMLEPGRYVELIRRLPIEQFDAIVDGKSDFLTGYREEFAAKLPFRLRVPFLSRKPARAWNAARGRWESPPKSNKPRHRGDCLAYYYAKAGPMVIDPGAPQLRRGRLRG